MLFPNKFWYYQNATNNLDIKYRQILHSGLELENYYNIGDQSYQYDPINVIFGQETSSHMEFLNFYKKYWEECEFGENLYEFVNNSYNLFNVGFGKKSFFTEMEDIDFENVSSFFYSNSVNRWIFLDGKLENTYYLRDLNHTKFMDTFHVDYVLGITDLMLNYKDINEHTDKYTFTISVSIDELLGTLHCFYTGNFLQYFSVQDDVICGLAYDNIHFFRHVEFEQYSSNGIDAALLESLKNNPKYTNFEIIEELGINDFSLRYCFECMYSGLDYIYILSGLILTYGINSICSIDYTSTNELLTIYIMQNFYFNNLDKDHSQLYYSAIVDYFFRSDVFTNDKIDEWTKAIFASHSMCLAVIYFPELLYFKNNFFEYVYENYLSNIKFIKYNVAYTDTVTQVSLVFLQFLFFLLFFFFLYTLYFSFFNSNKNESSTDFESITVSSLVESEKEIGSIEDIFLGILLLLFFFAWFFFLNFFTVVSWFPETILFMYAVPALKYIVVSIPTFLVYDFGIYYLIYLRGVGSTTSLLAELLFDYIAFIVFYARLVVQGVRLLLIGITYCSLHDLILFHVHIEAYQTGFERNWSNNFKQKSIFSGIIYFVILELPTKLFYWLFELLHTFFIITVQFSAFFVMVFWLFLFLYSFFVLERHEAYFEERILRRKQIYNELLNLKNKDV